MLADDVGVHALHRHVAGLGHQPAQPGGVEDGAGATAGTDVIAVLDGAPGTRFDLPVAHRPLVEGDDPYSAGPLAVADPQATTLVRALGAGLPDGAEGSWADLGVSLAAAMGLRLPGACAAGMRQAAARAG